MNTPFLIEFLAIFGLVAVVIFGPNWAILTYWVVVLGPVGVFGVAHSRVWRKRDELRRQQFNSGMRTKGLLDRFK